jgi:chemotaxis protein histidine kinase CheA
VGDRELETLIERAPALRRRPRPNGDRSAAGSLLRLQGLVGNSAVAALVQRTPTGAKPTPASIGEALSKVKLTTTKKTVKQLEPWEIYRLVTSNTPKKKALYKELRAAWTALEAAKKKLTAADDALAKSKAAPAPAPVPALARRTKTKKKTKAKAKPVDPAAVRTAAAAVVEVAQKRVDKALEAIKAFILADNDLLRKVRGDERSLKTSLTRAKAALARLKKRKKPDAAKVK